MTRLWTAIGDSFTHGTGDTHGGWIHRAFIELEHRDRVDRIDNRSAPGLLIEPVIDGQTLNIEPSTVISVIAGANDIMQPVCDLDELLRHVDQLIAVARPHTNTVVVSTCPDFTLPRTTTSKRLRGRIERLNDHVRTVAADDDQIVVIDANTILTEPGDWADDHVHPNPTGHHKLATATVDAIGRRLDVTCEST